MIDSQIFEALKAKAEEDSQVSEELSTRTKALDRDVAYAQGLLSRIHSTPKTNLPALMSQVEQEAIRPAVSSVATLAEFASKYPYYKYNFRWTRGVQNIVSAILLCAWLGGNPAGVSDKDIEGGKGSDKEQSIGRLLTIDEVGATLGVPVNVRDRDTFHLTVEEYLLALLDTVEELARLSMNAVTLGDIDLTVRISTFVKDVYAGFQLLNLKNDAVRRKFDGMKYHVKKVEDVIYDLSLRNLIPKPTPIAEKMEVK